MLQKFDIKTPRAMLSLGKKVSKKTKNGNVVFLKGPLGSGKSVFVRGFMKGYGVEEHILSPTFTLIQEYLSRDKRTKLYHFDLYRLSSYDEFSLIGGDDVVFGSDNISLIEWPELIENEYKGDSLIKINISINDDNSRSVEINSNFLIK